MKLHIELNEQTALDELLQEDEQQKYLSKLLAKWLKYLQEKDDNDI